MAPGPGVRREVARRTGELRTQALVACVQGILDVRENLPPEAMRRLFEQCGLVPGSR